MKQIEQAAQGLGATGHAARTFTQREPHLSLRRHALAMQDALAGMEPQASQAQRTESTVPGEAKKARKKLQYMRTAPANLVTLRSLLKKKRNKSAIAKRSGEQSKNSNEVSGLGCVVIPNCQRFNNIHCFLIFYCTVMIAQGEPEGLGLVV